MALIPKHYIDSVVAIGVKDDKGQPNWIGTGFFAYRKTAEEGQGLPFLISNKHVFEGKNEITLRMKVRDSEQLKEVDADLVEDGKQLYYTHANSDIDIAVLPLNGPAIEGLNLRFDGFDIDDQAMTSQELRNEGVDEGYLIYMLGYPMGLVMANSNIPLCRLGCIARMNEAQIDKSFNILVDIQNFPGNSGSPIVIRPELMSINGTKSFSKCVLIGIVHSYLPYREYLRNTQTGRIVEEKEENSGIANMHPVEYIRDIIDKISKING